MEFTIMKKTTQDTVKKNPRKRVQISFKSPTLTKQYFKDECDINNIVNRFQETGQIPLTNNLDPQYGFAPTMDLKTALDLVKKWSTKLRKSRPKNSRNFWSKCR
ncbi:internal scaffolding protein [Microviridae sp.]|nr:internal scaffolding protein [Microviridae sp.]